MPAIELQGLTKVYSTGYGCRNITLSVPEGVIFGLLGPNGAGKSTLVKMLVGLLQPTAGKAQILGLPLGDLSVRARIGYLPELFRYQDWLTGEEVLRFHGRLAGRGRDVADARIHEVLAEVGLAQKGRERVKQYSKGMQQRLGLACALLLQPDIVFLDEPTSALDPIGRQDVRQILKGLRARGTTVFLNTHLLDDVELLCDEVALLHHGEIIAKDDVANIKNRNQVWVLQVGGWSEDVAEALRYDGVSAIRIVEMNEMGTGTIEVTVQNRDRLGWVNHHLMQNGVTLYQVSPLEQRMEDWFFSLVSETRGDGA